MAWVKEFNKKSLKKSIYNLYENDEICSIMINYPALLLRKKSALYPEGRTSYRFKRQLRNLVTVHGKTNQVKQTGFAVDEKSTNAAQNLYKPSEMDLPETDEPATEQ